MLRLRTLGGLTIEDETGPLAGAIARKRSLALLALVGLATEQGISRDRMLAYLWPESAIDRGNPTTAVTLYRGQFLDGFYLPALAEFERWVESERAGLAQRYAGALE